MYDIKSIRENPEAFDAALAQGRLEGVEAGLGVAEKEAQSVILQARMGEIDKDGVRVSLPVGPMEGKTR